MSASDDQKSFLGDINHKLCWEGSAPCAASACEWAGGQWAIWCQPKLFIVNFTPVLVQDQPQISNTFYQVKQNLLSSWSPAMYRLPGY